MELKLVAWNHLDALKAVERGAPARMTAKDDFTVMDYFRAFNSERSVALQVLNAPDARLCQGSKRVRNGHIRSRGLICISPQSLSRCPHTLRGLSLIHI